MHHLSIAEPQTDRQTSRWLLSSLTAQVLRRVVDIYPWTTTQGLIEVVKQVGRRLIRANPMEFLVANVVRRVSRDTP